MSPGRSSSLVISWMCPLLTSVSVLAPGFSLVRFRHIET